jgi:hypothetical protein
MPLFVRIWGTWWKKRGPNLGESLLLHVKKGRFHCFFLCDTPCIFDQRAAVLFHPKSYQDLKFGKIYSLGHNSSGRLLRHKTGLWSNQATGIAMLQ